MRVLKLGDSPLSLSYVDEYCKVAMRLTLYSSTLKRLSLIINIDFLAQVSHYGIEQIPLHNHQHQENRYSLYTYQAYPLCE